MRKSFSGIIQICKSVIGSIIIFLNKLFCWIEGIRFIQLIFVIIIFYYNLSTNTVNCCGLIKDNFQYSYSATKKIINLEKVSNFNFSQEYSSWYISQYLEKKMLFLICWTLVDFLQITNAIFYVMHKCNFFWGL